MKIPSCGPSPNSCHKEAHSCFGCLFMLSCVNFLSLELKGQAQTCSSMKMTLCINWFPWRHGLPWLELKNLSGLHRSLTSTPLNTYEMNWNASSPDIGAWPHECSCGCIRNPFSLSQMWSLVVDAVHSSVTLLSVFVCAGTDNYGLTGADEMSILYCVCQSKNRKVMHTAAFHIQQFS